jgi:hypothetical protein
MGGKRREVEDEGEVRGATRTDGDISLSQFQAVLSRYLQIPLARVHFSIYLSLLQPLAHLPTH